MHRPRLLAASALLMTLPLGTGLAGAAEGECRPLSTDRPEITLCEETGYLAGAVGNLDGGVTLVDEAPAEGTTRRDGGYHANVVAGSTFLDNTDPTWQPAITGTFTGTMDSLEAALYVTNPVDGALGADSSYRVRLTVDGRVLHDSYDVDTDIATDHLSDDLSVASLRFTNLVGALERRGMDNGDDTEHTYLLEVTEFYYGDGNNVLWYGSDEAPSSMTVNLAGTSYATTFALR